MTEAEIRTMLAAIDACRQAIAAALPLDDTAQPDTVFEMGYVLGVTANLQFLLIV